MNNSTCRRYQLCAKCVFKSGRLEVAQTLFLWDKITIAVLPVSTHMTRAVMYVIYYMIKWMHNHFFPSIFLSFFLSIYLSGFLFFFFLPPYLPSSLPLFLSFFLSVLFVFAASTLPWFLSCLFAFCLSSFLASSLPCFLAVILFGPAWQHFFLGTVHCKKGNH